MNFAAIKDKIGPIKETFGAFGQDKASTLAGSIAYSTIFSLTPLLIVLIAIARRSDGLAFQS